MSTLAVMVSLLVLSDVAENAFQSTNRPSLSGHWFMDKTGISPNAPRAFWIVCGWECEVIDSGTSLVVRSAERGETRFRLDGVPETRVSRFGEFTSESTRSATREGSTVVLSSKAGRFETRTVLSIKSSRLMVEIRSTGREGEPAITRSVYQRRSPPQ